MLPQNLIVEFWDQVKKDLRDRYHLKEPEALQAITVYRSALERHNVGEIVYHRFPESVSETIADGWKTGFPDPHEQPKAERKAS